MVYLQILAYKVLDTIWTLFGKLRLLVRVSKSITLEDIDLLVINRADRIGDAVISRPFFECLVDHLRSHGWQGSVRILSSSLNHAILEPFGSMQGVEVIMSSTAERYAYTRSIYRTLCMCVRSLVMFTPRILGRMRSRVAFVDLVDSVNEMMIGEFSEYHNAYWMSSNRGPFSFLFDATTSERFAGSAGTQLVEAQIQAFSDFLSLPDLRSYVYSQVTRFYPEYPDVTPKNILLFVGAKEFRNFEVTVWSRLAREFARVFPEQEIHIHDADEFAIIGALKLETNLPKNVIFVERAFSFAELSDHAAGYQFVMGIDGGGINMMRSHTNSVSVFTFGNHAVWGPLLAGAVPRSYRWGAWECAFAHLPNGRLAGNIWKHSFWLPSFQIPFKRSFVSDFPVGEFVAGVRGEIG